MDRHVYPNKTYWCHNGYHLAEDRANGSENGARSGAQTLVLLATPLNCLVLQDLYERPKRMAELRRGVGFPPQTTLRAQLKRLMEVGAVEAHRDSEFPGVLDYELTPCGRELLFVIATLEHWLEDAPDGPLSLGSSAAKAVIKALAEGWSTRMLRALAVTPRSLTELDRVIESVSYPSLERRLAAMRAVGQLEACDAAAGRGTAYAITDWMRHAIAPLVAAASWEQRRQPDTAPPITRADTEAAFLLTLPLLSVPSDLDGDCRMAVEVTECEEHGLAGVIAHVEGGQVVSCATQLEGKPTSSALGPAPAWLDAVIDHDLQGLELSGDRDLARELVGGLHQTLFGLNSSRDQRILK
jgi:DNA-binding HxlR family transcriptional regulator